MPLKVSSRSVNPYARGIPRKKLQQDRRGDRRTDQQTDTQTGIPKDKKTHRRIVQNDFPRRFDGVVYIPNPVLSKTRFFARCQYFHVT